MKRIPSIVKNAVKKVRPDIHHFSGMEDDGKSTLERLIE